MGKRQSINCFSSLLQEKWRTQLQPLVVTVEDSVEDSETEDVEDEAEIAVEVVETAAGVVAEDVDVGARKRRNGSQ